jgi:hypothetical protein
MRRVRFWPYGVDKIHLFGTAYRVAQSAPPPVAATVPTSRIRSQKAARKQMVENVGKNARLPGDSGRPIDHAAWVVLRENAIGPFLAGAPEIRSSRRSQAALDRHYETVRFVMAGIFHSRVAADRQAISNCFPRPGRLRQKIPNVSQFSRRYEVQWP